MRNVSESSITQAVVHSFDGATDPRFKTIIEEGTRTGEFKDTIDKKLAVMTLFSSLNWMPMWYDPASKIDPQNLGQQLADMLVNGLKKS